MILSAKVQRGRIKVVNKEILYRKKEEISRAWER